MKQMRSRFRLLSLLMACAFLLVLVLCTGNVLKTADIDLSSLSSLLPQPGVSVSPSVSPDASVSPGTTVSPSSLFDWFNTPAPSESVPAPGTDNSPNPEYNLYGL
ncbi:MAG: hypothetical protein J5841_02725 [Clostridia bacterium]|nr:hypothetical protein [Clostridia bacterium]